MVMQHHHFITIESGNVFFNLLFVQSWTEIQQKKNKQTKLAEKLLWLLMVFETFGREGKMLHFFQRWTAQRPNFSRAQTSSR